MQLSQTPVQVLTYLEPVLCLVALAAILLRRQLSNFKFVAAFLAVRILAAAILLTLLNLVGKHAIQAHILYQIYFYGYWLSYAVEAILCFAIAYELYKLTMEPLRGLQRLGAIIFRCLAALAVLAALYNPLWRNMTSARLMMLGVSRLQTVESIFSLAILLFIILAIRPLGLTFRSSIFGVSLGFGILTLDGLVIESLFRSAMDRRILSLINLLNGLTILVCVTIWAIYLTLAEPSRRTLNLSPNSFILRWNRRLLGPTQGPAI